MGDTLRPADLESCDVLLSRGSSWFARAIRAFDGAPVSHAALYIERGMVAEATGQGVVRRRLEAGLAEAERVLVRRLAPAPPTLRPVRRLAATIVGEGHRYAYEQIVLLAFLCLTRRLVPTPSLSRLVRGVLDAAAARIAALLSTGVEPMICSEFVYRAYDEADPDPRDAYTIEIVPLPRSARVPGTVRLDAIRAPGVAGYGRGVHRESVLARLAGPTAARSRAPHAGERPQRPAGSSQRAPASPPSDAELQDLFEAHLRERRRMRASPAPLRIGGELRAAVERFAAAWAVCPPTRGRRQGGAKRPHPKRSRVSGATLGRPPLDALFEVAADFVTPGDLLRTKSLRTEGDLLLPSHVRGKRGASTRRPAGGHPARPRHSLRRAARKRRDPGGGLWTLAKLESEILGLVARLSPGVDRSEITRATSFGRDLGWDEWSKLRLRLPVREKFHVVLSAVRVKDLERVGSLADAVWDEMEEVP